MTFGWLPSFTNATSSADANSTAFQAYDDIAAMAAIEAKTSPQPLSATVLNWVERLFISEDTWQFCGRPRGQDLLLLIIIVDTIALFVIFARFLVRLIREWWNRKPKKPYIPRAPKTQAVSAQDSVQEME